MTTSLSERSALRTERGTGRVGSRATAREMGRRIALNCCERVAVVRSLVNDALRDDLFLRFLLGFYRAVPCYWPGRS